MDPQGSFIYFAHKNLQKEKFGLIRSFKDSQNDLWPHNQET